LQAAKSGRKETKGNNSIHEKFETKFPKVSQDCRTA